MKENISAKEREVRISRLGAKNLREWDEVTKVAKLIKDERAEIRTIRGDRVAVMI